MNGMRRLSVRSRFLWLVNSVSAFGVSYRNMAEGTVGSGSCNAMGWRGSEESGQA